MANPAKSKKQNSKTGKAPTATQRAQAAARREAQRDGLPKEQAKLTDFVERFCQEFVRCGVLEEAHRAAEVALRVPLDTSGYHVEEERGERTVKGKKVTYRILHIYDSNGRPMPENDLRISQASNLYLLPEVRRRIRELRAEHAKLISVNAETMVEEIELLQAHALRSGQLQVGANLLAMKAKMFGIEAGPGEGAGGAPATSVNINIRDFSSKTRSK